MRQSRRNFFRNLAVASSVLSASARHVLAQRAASSVFHGVQVGVQSYSFRDRSFDEAVTGAGMLAAFAAAFGLYGATALVAQAPAPATS